MEDAGELRAAIAELDRRQKKIINQIKHARKQAAEAEARAEALTVEVTQVQETWLDLIGRLRAIETGDDNE